MIEALVELRFADSDRAKAFNCSTCPKSVQNLRRCREERNDFTDADGNIWPMRVREGGALFSFCPAKATWDREAVLLYNSLVLSYETKTNWASGGLEDQPMWWIDLASWFTTVYSDSIFYSRAKAVLGDGKNKANTTGVPRNGLKQTRSVR